MNVGATNKGSTLDVNVGATNKGGIMDACIKELVDDETNGAFSQM
jgi:hypothetical protein